MAVRKINAFKYDFGSIIVCQRRPMVIYGVIDNGPISTPDGEMRFVKLGIKMDIADPNQDVAALLGILHVKTTSGFISPHSPELWYWNDAFWVKAKNVLGIQYYHNKQYVFYQITPRDRDVLMINKLGQVELIIDNS